VGNTLASADDKVNILLVDDQPGKLLSYEAVLGELDENLIKANSGREALEHLLKNDIGVILVDVCMPEIDGFELVEEIREHPRFQKISIIFISAIQFSELDHLRGYEMGAVDYVPVPVVPEVLRAKVRVFVELHRKTRQLEALNAELERRVAERTSELEASNARLRQSEHRRNLSLSAANMGSWDYDVETGVFNWDDGQYRIFGVEPASFRPTEHTIKDLVHAGDRESVLYAESARDMREGYRHEFRVVRPNGDIRWCFSAVAPTIDEKDQTIRLSGVTMDITDRKQDEERQSLLAREVDHRAKNAITVIQSFLYLTKAKTIDEFVSSVEGRIKALAATHNLLSAARWRGADITSIVDDELAPYRAGSVSRARSRGPALALRPAAAQTFALALHELATNAAKYGGLSTPSGSVDMAWRVENDTLVIDWIESGGPEAKEPPSTGFGLKLITASIEAQLGGDVGLDWKPKGLVCRIAIPLKEVLSSSDERAAAKAAKAAEPPEEQSTIALNGRRVLVVEDEILISMMLQDTLLGLGLDVVGPVNNMASAVATVNGEPLDGAILDLNLGGNLIYPLADMLIEREIPFVFLTGYDRSKVPPRYASVPVLHKPVSPEMLRDCLLTGLVSRAA